MVRRVPRAGPALHQLTRVPEAAVSLVVDAISVEPSLVWTIAVQEKASELRSEVCGLSTGCRNERARHRGDLSPSATTYEDARRRPWATDPQTSADRNGRESTRDQRGFPENEAPRYLLHDRDTVFADVAITTAGMNIQAVRTASRSRTHLALGKDTPLTRPVSPPLDGRIVATPEVGGLHHRYDHIAA